MLNVLLIPDGDPFGIADPFADLRGGVYGLYDNLKGLLEVIMLFAALIIFIRLVMTLSSGDKDAAKKLLVWLLGLAFGFIMMEVIYDLLIAK